MTFTDSSDTGAFSVASDQKLELRARRTKWPRADSVSLHVSPDLDPSSLSNKQWGRLTSLHQRALCSEVASNVPLPGGTWGVWLTGVRNCTYNWDIYTGYIQCPATRKRAPVQVKIQSFGPVYDSRRYLSLLSPPYSAFQELLDYSQRQAYKVAGIYTGPLRDLQGSVVLRFYGLYSTTVNRVLNLVMIQELAGTPLVTRSIRDLKCNPPPQISSASQETFDELIEIIKTLHAHSAGMGSLCHRDEEAIVERRVAPSTLVNSGLKGVPASMRPAPGSESTLVINKIHSFWEQSPDQRLHGEWRDGQECVYIVDAELLRCEEPGTAAYLAATLPPSCPCESCAVRITNQRVREEQELRDRWNPMPDVYLRRKYPKLYKEHNRDKDFKYGPLNRGELGNQEESPQEQERKETQKNLELAKRQRRLQRNSTRRAEIVPAKRAATALRKAKTEAREAAWEALYDWSGEQAAELEELEKQEKIEMEEAYKLKEIAWEQRRDRKRQERRERDLMAEGRNREIRAGRATKWVC